MAGTTAASAADSGKIRYYGIEYFYMKNGSQPARLHEFLRDGMLPALNRVHSGPKMVLEALVAPQMPQVAVINGFTSWEEVIGMHHKVSADPDFRKSIEAWEKGEDAPYESSTNVILEATDYSPSIVAPKQPPKTPRVFELRVYHSPTFRQLRALHERFASAEIPIFHRSGVHPILYSSTVVGPNRPNLTYLIPFDSLADREKAWNAFGADPEWAKVRKESIDKYGQVSSVIQISLYRATPYSPVR